MNNRYRDDDQRQGYDEGGYRRDRDENRTRWQQDQSGRGYSQQRGEQYSRDWSQGSSSYDPNRGEYGNRDERNYGPDYGNRGQSSGGSYGGRQDYRSSQSSRYGGSQSDARSDYGSRDNEGWANRSGRSSAFGSYGSDRNQRYRDEPRDNSATDYGSRDYSARGDYGSRSDYAYASGSSGYGARDDFSNRYGAPERPYRDAPYGSEDYRGGERGLWDKATDEVSSWFGDRDAERRREMDKYRGRGPKSYARSDDRIKDDVNDRLTDDGYLDATDIDVSVKDREVTLSGEVASRNAKRRAEDLAEAVSGVKHVQNNLRVKEATASEWSGSDTWANRSTTGATGSTSSTTGSATSSTSGTSGSSGTMSSTTNPTSASSGVTGSTGSVGSGGTKSSI